MIRGRVSPEKKRMDWRMLQALVGFDCDHRLRLGVYGAHKHEFKETKKKGS